MNRGSTGKGGDSAEFERVLAETEAAARQAIVPGELPAWCELLEPELDQVGGSARARGAQEEALLAQILEEDLKLTPVVEALRAARADLDRRIADLQARARGFREYGDRSDSAEPTKEGEALRLEVLAWIVEARAHAGELGTWFQESLYRDRGVQG